MRRRLTELLVGVLIALAVLGHGVAANATSWNTSCETYMVNHINTARKAHGLRPYTATSTLQYYARHWALHMESTQTLSHDPNLTRHYRYWRAMGQNVGEGPSCYSVWHALMQSTDHRSNILSRYFTQVGVGVVTDGNGIDWVAQDFREP